MRAVLLPFAAVILLLLLATCSPLGFELLPTTGPAGLTVPSATAGPLETTAAPHTAVPTAELTTVAPTAAPTAEPPTVATTATSTAELLTVTPAATSTTELPAVTPTAVPSTETPTAVPPTSTPPGDTLLEEQTIGEYTLRLSAAGRLEIRIEAVTAIGSLPAEDITGDGFPDLELETYAGGSHCCSGTVVYSLGPIPEEVLHITASGSNDTGRGTFQDLDGDGVYEFITADPLAGIPCTQPIVRVILRYDPDQGYVGASLRFPQAYAADVAAYTQAAEAGREATRDGYECDVYPLIVTYLYLGRPDLARQALDLYYLGPDPDGFLDRLQQSVAAGRFYMPE
jgi:hypothetical protein